MPNNQTTAQTHIGYTPPNKCIDGDYLLMTLKDDNFREQMKKVITVHNCYIKKTISDYRKILYVLFIVGSSQYHEQEFCISDSPVAIKDAEYNVIIDAMGILYLYNKPLDAITMKELNRIYKKYK